MISNFSPLWISVKVAFVATFFTFFIGLFTAYSMLFYRGRWKSFIEGIILLPLILPPTVIGFLLLILLGKNGIIGKTLGYFHVTVVLSWYAGAIAATVVSFPLMYRASLGAFEQLDSNMLKAARTLGASELTIFWRVLFPLALPGILGGTILSFARALGEFGATLMLAGNIAGQTQTIPIAIYFAVEAGAIEEAGLWSLIVTGISLTALMAVNFSQQSLRRKLYGDTYEVPKYKALSYGLREVRRYDSNYKLSVDIRKQFSGFCLNVSFGNDDQALAILGASGAGKTLILRCIAGLETPNQGRILLNGKILFDADQQINLPSQDRSVGFLFQNYALFPHLTVAQNIGFGLAKGWSQIQIQQKVAAQLETMEIEGMGDRYPYQLSGGQQQRVALGRALASQPDILLLDEPFSALDTHLRSQMEKKLISILSTYKGVTLLVTHNQQEAIHICKNLMIIDRGEIVHI